MTNRKNSRYTKRSEHIDPYVNLATDIIIDALLIAAGQNAASDKERAEAVLWVRGEQCQRWADVVGVNIWVALEHRDCVLEIET